METVTAARRELEVARAAFGEPAWCDALADFVRTAAMRRGLTAGELGHSIDERLCTLAAPAAPQPATDFLRQLFADPRDATVQVDGDEGVRLTPRELALLGLIACEAVANARRHAVLLGRELRIWVKLVHERGQIRLTVRDNGLGPQDVAPDPQSGRGLMAAAAQQLGGYARLGAAPFGGGLASAVFRRA
jgi:hypothetical protein